MRRLSRALAAVALTGTTAAAMLGGAQPAQAAPADCPNATGYSDTFVCIQTAGPDTAVPLVGGQTITVGGQTVGPVALTPAVTIQPLSTPAVGQTVPGVVVSTPDEICVLGNCIPEGTVLASTPAVPVNVPSQTITPNPTVIPAVTVPAVTVPVVSQKVPSTVPVVVPAVWLKSALVPGAVETVNQAVANAKTTVDQRVVEVQAAVAKAINDALVAANGAVTLVINTAGQVVGIVQATAAGAVATVLTAAGEAQSTVYRTIGDANGELNRKIAEGQQAVADATVLLFGKIAWAQQVAADAKAEADRQVQTATEEVEKQRAALEELVAEKLVEVNRQLAEALDAANEAAAWVLAQGLALVGAAYETVMEVVGGLPTVGELVAIVMAQVEEALDLVEDRCARVEACRDPVGTVEEICAGQEACSDPVGTANAVVDLVVRTACARVDCSDPVGYLVDRIHNLCDAATTSGCDVGDPVQKVKDFIEQGVVCENACQTVVRRLYDLIDQVCAIVRCDAITYE